MNNLSWMIYLAEVCERVQGVAEILAFMLGFMGAFAVFAMWMHVSEIGAKVAASLTVLYLLVELPLIALGAFTPSSSTIYMIAASEAGETVVTSPEAKEMLGDLKEIIRRKLKEELNDEVGI